MFADLPSEEWSQRPVSLGRLVPRDKGGFAVMALATTTTIRRLGTQAEGVMGGFSGTLANVDRLVADTDPNP